MILADPPYGLPAVINQPEGPEIARVRAIIRDHADGTRATLGLERREVMGILEENGLCAAIPRPQGRDAADDARREATWACNTRILFTTRKVTETLANDRIRHLVVEGPLLAQRVHGDAFVRPWQAVELLVPPYEIERAAAAIEAIGLARVGDARPAYLRGFSLGRRLVPVRPDLSEVDLQDSVRHPAGPAAGAMDAFLSGAVRTRFGDVQVPVPGPLDAFLLSSIALMRAVLDRRPAGGHVLDLATMRTRLTPANVRALSELAGGRRVGTALSFAMDVVSSLGSDGAHVPSAASAFLWGALGNDDVWRRILVPSAMPALNDARCVTAACDGVGDRIRALSRDLGLKAATRIAEAGPPLRENVARWGGSIKAGIAEAGPPLRENVVRWGESLRSAIPDDAAASVSDQVGESLHALASTLGRLRSRIAARAAEALTVEGERPGRDD